MPRRYHPALVILHWLIAFLVIGALTAGTFILNSTPNSDPSKILSFQMHMGLGVAILVLMLVRLAVRVKTTPPPTAETGSAALGILARATHVGLYVLAIGMAVSGVALSITSGLPDAVFGDATLPADFSAYPARAVHGVIATGLIALIALHAAAALWHQFIRRDGLMARMWFGTR